MKQVALLVRENRWCELQACLDRDGEMTEGHDEGRFTLALDDQVAKLPPSWPNKRRRPPGMY